MGARWALGGPGGLCPPSAAGPSPPSDAYELRRVTHDSVLSILSLSGEASASFTPVAPTGQRPRLLGSQRLSRRCFRARPLLGGTAWRLGVFHAPSACPASCVSAAGAYGPSGGNSSLRTRPSRPVTAPRAFTHKGRSSRADGSASEVLLPSRAGSLLGRRSRGGPEGEPRWLHPEGEAPEGTRQEARGRQDPAPPSGSRLDVPPPDGETHSCGLQATGLCWLAAAAGQSKAQDRARSQGRSQTAGHSAAHQARPLGAEPSAPASGLRGPGRSSRKRQSPSDQTRS